MNNKKRNLELIGLKDKFEDDKNPINEEIEEKDDNVIYEISDSLLDEINKLDEKDDEECDNPGEKKKSKGKGKGKAKGKGKGPIGKPSNVKEAYQAVLKELK